MKVHEVRTHGCLTNRKGANTGKACTYRYQGLHGFALECALCPARSGTRLPRSSATASPRDECRGELQDVASSSAAVSESLPRHARSSPALRAREETKSPCGEAVSLNTANALRFNASSLQHSMSGALVPALFRAQQAFRLVGLRNAPARSPSEP